MRSLTLAGEVQNLTTWVPCQTRSPDAGRGSYSSRRDVTAALTITLRGQVGFLLLDLTLDSIRKRQQQMQDADVPSDLDRVEQEDFAASCDVVQSSWRELGESISDRAVALWMKREFVARKHGR